MKEPPSLCEFMIIKATWQITDERIEPHAKL